jgi:protein SCO1/2
MTLLLKNKSYIFIILILISCKNFTATDTSLPFINNPDFTPEWISKNDKAYSSIHQIPPFSFINQNSETITEKTVENKIYVTDFFFTKCGSICPKMTTNMGFLQTKFMNDKDVMLLSHTVTPEWDSVPVLKEYAKNKGVISGKWHLLTGNKDEIYSLAKKQYFAGDTIGYYQTGNEFLHTENFILVDKKRRIRGVYNGTLPLEIERLSDDILELKKEN